jgi:hypothetical protein
MNHRISCAALLVTCSTIGCGGEPNGHIDEEDVTEVQSEATLSPAERARLRLLIIGLTIDRDRPVPNLPNDEELQCKSLAGTLTCTSPLDFVCPSSFGPCLAAGATTCCTKKL